MRFKQYCSIELIFLLYTTVGGINGCRCDAPETRKKSTDIAPSDSADMHHKLFSDAVSAVAEVLAETDPGIIAFGEYHQQIQTTGVQSALKRFTNSILPSVKHRLTDLVVETWISTGGCGKNEGVVTNEVDKVTKRPAATEDETVTLIRTAAAFGIKPSVLELACDDYGRLIGDAGVDYLALLELVGERLGSTAKRAYLDRHPSGAARTPRQNGVVAIFGGAIHNDARPLEMWKTVSFGPDLATLDAGYIEIDLVVPEFVENSDVAKKERWYPIFEETASHDAVSLIETGPRAYVLVLKKGITD